MVLKNLSNAWHKLVSLMDDRFDYLLSFTKIGWSSRTISIGNFGHCWNFGLIWEHAKIYHDKFYDES